MTVLDELLSLKQRRIEQLHCLEPGRTALLVIDMQRAFLEPGAALELPPGRAIIPNLQRLIQYEDNYGYGGGEEWAVRDRRPLWRMTRIPCDVEEVDLEGDYRDDVPGVCVTCSRCQHVTESYGTGGASIRRCLALMREECPRGQRNFYVADGQDDG